jgi:GMP synthase (glutamine-hydrolysing)
MLLSGGVDSTVMAALMVKALGQSHVIGIHINNGFMRKDESEQVQQSLEKLGLKIRGNDLLDGDSIHAIRLLFSVEDASNDFLLGDTTIKVEDTTKGLWTSRKTDLLCYVVEPEEKRRIIGDTFMEVAKKVMVFCLISSEHARHNNPMCYCRSLRN